MGEERIRSAGGLCIQTNEDTVHHCCSQQSLANSSCNQQAICLHAVYMSHVTTLPGYLARKLGIAGQADWPFAYIDVCPKHTILMAFNT
jgi:hypothetical protein